MVKKTVDEYNQVIKVCKKLFEEKTRDYGTAWRVLRPSSLTDQIFIKAQRIRSIQEKGEQKVDEGVTEEFIGIINYCIMAILQLKFEKEGNDKLEMEYEELETYYDLVVLDISALLQDKNHDYDEAWRDMRVSSITDIILMKLLRVKQIENNEGKTLVSEGIQSNYQDMINYAVFALIKMGLIKDEDR